MSVPEVMSVLRTDSLTQNRVFTYAWCGRGVGIRLDPQYLASEGVVFVLVNEPLREQFCYLSESRLNR